MTLAARCHVPSTWTRWPSAFVQHVSNRKAAFPRTTVLQPWEAVSLRSLGQRARLRDADCLAPGRPRSAPGSPGVPTLPCDFSQADLTGGPHSAMDPHPLFLGQVTLRPGLGCVQTNDTTCVREDNEQHISALWRRPSFWSKLLLMSTPTTRAGLPGLRALSLRSVTAPTPAPALHLPQGPRMSQDVPGQPAAAFTRLHSGRLVPVSVGVC